MENLSPCMHSHVIHSLNPRLSLIPHNHFKWYRACIYLEVVSYDCLNVIHVELWNALADVTGLNDTTVMPVKKEPSHNEYPSLKHEKGLD